MEQEYFIDLPILIAIQGYTLPTYIVFRICIFMKSWNVECICKVTISVS